ncbi:MAG: CoA pyrophosphatase [Deltaproteobacteria bacterium]|nr:CoA pyrophosphatase [Deltaproteobacteria bacterium]
MHRYDVDLVRQRLSGLEPVTASDQGRRAAVAMILRDAGHAEGAELLFIRRAEDPRDPWSGHMAFPGGRQDAGDGGDLLVTATRETAEELGLDLGVHGEPLGRLHDLPAIARGRPVGMVIRPYAFALRGAPVLRPNHEVAEVVWAPLGPIARGEWRTTYPYVWEGRHLELPGHRVGQSVVWGLTHQMIEMLLDALHR